MSILIFRANTTLKTLRIHLSSNKCFGRFGHHQVDFTKTHMEMHIEVDASISQRIHQNT